jgi:hypothetical protein
MKKIIQLPKLTLTHLIIKVIIFLIFLTGIIFKVSTPFLYLALVLIVANLTIGIIEKQRAVIMNITLFILGILQFIIFIGYIATLIGSVLSLIHLALFLTKTTKKD